MKTLQSICMGKNGEFCFGWCNNDKWYADRLVKHGFTANPVRCQEWIKVIGKGSAGLSIRKMDILCSNHLVDGEPTSLNPSLYVNLINKQKKSPVKQHQLSHKFNNDDERLPCETFCDALAHWISS